MKSGGDPIDGFHQHDPGIGERELKFKSTSRGPGKTALFTTLGHPFSKVTTAAGGSTRRRTVSEWR